MVLDQWVGMFVQQEGGPWFKYPVPHTNLGMVVCTCTSNSGRPEKSGSQELVGQPACTKRKIIDSVTELT